MTAASGTRVSDFRDLIAWRKAMAFVTSVYRVTQSYPSAERFGLIAQLRRAAVAIPANIAEGRGRATAGEYLNQLSVARGSLNEVITLVAISRNLTVAPAAELDQLDHDADELGRILYGLRRGLEASRQRHQ